METAIPSYLVLFQMCAGHYLSRAIYVVAKLGIADLLADGPRENVDLAEATGGFVSRFANVLTNAVARAAEEARSYYIVGYVPIRKDDGKFRRVRVRVNRDDVTVRTKKGYIAGGIDGGLVSRRVH